MSNWLSEGKVGRDWFGLDLFRPGPRFLRDGGCLYLLDEVPSTNDFLCGRGPAAPGRRCLWDGWGWKGLERRQLDPPLAPEPGTVVVARRQTRGKGRQGRDWVDCGGLHLSVLVPSHRATMDHGFPVWLGLIVTKVLRERFQLDARLKWPNDILVGGRKLGGILLELRGPDSHRRVVAGLGLNLTTRPAEFPGDLREIATSVHIESDRVLKPGECAGRIIHRVEVELDRFRAEGWDPYREALGYLDALLGRTVEVRTGDREKRGRVEGVDDRGQLVLRDDGGAVHHIPAGDVHVLTDTPERSNGRRADHAGADS